MSRKCLVMKDTDLFRLGGGGLTMTKKCYFRLQLQSQIGTGAPAVHGATISKQTTPVQENNSLQCKNNRSDFKDNTYPKPNIRIFEYSRNYSTVSAK